MGNLGIAAQFESRLDEAIEAYGRAIAVARSAECPTCWGLAALNLGVLSQKCGDYDRARELFAEALALFAAVKHSEYQLAALFNMAHVERELGLWESAAELYEATIPLAQRIGQSDIEIGAIAGAGLCALELGRIDAAREAIGTIQARVSDRPDWFQGREIAEALFVRLAVARRATDRGVQPFYVGACSGGNVRSLLGGVADGRVRRIAGRVRPSAVRSSITRYGDRVRELGYAEMTRRYDVAGSTVTGLTAAICLVGAR